MKRWKSVGSTFLVIALFKGGVRILRHLPVSSNQSPQPEASVVETMEPVRLGDSNRSAPLSLPDLPRLPAATPAPVRFQQLPPAPVLPTVKADSTTNLSKKLQSKPTPKPSEEPIPKPPVERRLAPKSPPISLPKEDPSPPPITNTFNLPRVEAMQPLPVLDAQTVSPTTVDNEQQSGESGQDPIPNQQNQPDFPYQPDTPQDQAPEAENK
jgi:hypothetical protein